MDKTPIISVVITTKNRITLLPRAINSVLEQSGPTLEMIVVDDGSDVPVVLPTNDPRVRILRNEVSKGLSAARNSGFGAARGNYFCILDDDDWYLPGKLEKQLKYLQEHPDVDLVFSRVVVRNSEGENHCYLPEDHVHTPEINLRAFNVIHPASVLFRRSVFDNIQFDPAIKKYEDTLFFNRVCFAHRTAYLPLDVAVWMQDGRPDQLTRVIYDRNFINFRIVCSGLHEILRRHPAARRQYYSRLAFQALRCGRIGESVKAAALAGNLVDR